MAKRVLRELAAFASDYVEPMQLQISLVSTSDEYRSAAVGQIAASISDIRKGIEMWTELNPKPVGRKVNASIVLGQNTPADPQALLKVLPPELVNIRLRDYVTSVNGSSQQLCETSDSDYQTTLQRFRECGYDTSELARPTDTERKFNLSPNSTLARYISQAVVSSEPE
jgi:hypothetical protein